MAVRSGSPGYPHVIEGDAVSVLMLLLGAVIFAAMYGFTYACDRF